LSEQYVSTAGHREQSLYRERYYLSVIVCYLKELLNFKYQPEGEAGAAEEQPASNKADAYTIEKKNW
jgi:hypothetical protein